MYVHENYPEVELVAENTGALFGFQTSTLFEHLDGIAETGVFYGYENYNEATSDRVRDLKISWLQYAQDLGLTALALDYCSSSTAVSAFQGQLVENSLIGFAATSFEMDTIPDSTAINDQQLSEITTLGEVQNFIRMENSFNFFDFYSIYVGTIKDNYADLVILDPLFHYDMIDPGAIGLIGTKANDVKRPVYASVNIGQAETRRYYWEEDWNSNPPAWVEGNAPEMGKMVVDYSSEDWKNILFGNSSAYLDSLISLGYDGIYLTGLDAFKYRD